MGPEFVTVLAGGREWSAFKRVEVHASFEDAARSFILRIAAEPGATPTAWTFKPGTLIDILSNGDLLCRGYVDRYQPQLSEHTQSEIIVSGRSKSQDFIDSAAMHDTGEFKDKTPLDIAKALDKFGIGFSADVPLDKIPFARIVQGETAFRCVEKLCRSQGVFMPGQPDGSIKLTVAGKARHAGAIIEGVNLKAGNADHNWSNRHSHVTVRGQRPSGSSDDDLEVEATAQDEAVQRYRPTVIVHDGDTDKGRATKRAKHRRDREAGRALQANEIRLQGFRDDAGQLWTPGNLVFIQSPFLALAQDMAIKTVQFTQERGHGSETVLSVCDPRALGGKAGKASGASAGKTDAAWNYAPDDI